MCLVHRAAAREVLSLCIRPARPAEGFINVAKPCPADTSLAVRSEGLDVARYRRTTPPNALHGKVGCLGIHQHTTICILGLLGTHESTACAGQRVPSIGFHHAYGSFSYPFRPLSEV